MLRLDDIPQQVADDIHTFGVMGTRKRIDKPPLLCYNETSNTKGGVMMFNEIKTKKDIQEFIDKTNSLHDGYIIGVQYTNDAITNVDENGYFINPNAKKLSLRILVTSIWDTVVEIEFDGALEWQVLNDTYYVILDTSVSFNDKGYIVWADGIWSNREELEGCSFAIAKSMKWRIVE